MKALRWTTGKEPPRDGRQIPRRLKVEGIGEYWLVEADDGLRTVLAELDGRGELLEVVSELLRQLAGGGLARPRIQTEPDGGAS